MEKLLKKDNADRKKIAAKFIERLEEPIHGTHHDMPLAPSTIDHLQSRGITLSYVFLSKEGRFSWALTGERQD